MLRTLTVENYVLIDRLEMELDRSLNIITGQTGAGKSILLGALGLYAPLRDFAGCGASVPLIGFGGTVAIGVREAVNTHGLIGALEGGLTSASAGTSAALCFGYLAAIIFSGKPKRMSKRKL